MLGSSRALSLNPAKPPVKTAADALLLRVLMNLGTVLLPFAL